MNKARGEGRIKLGPDEWTIDPTFENIARFEQASGVGLLDFTRRVAVGQASLTEIAAFLWATIDHGGALSKNDIGQGLLVHPLTDTTAVLADVLFVVLNGNSGADEDQPASGNKKK